ncbi:ThiF family adenylyltransferase [Terricaulis sp.]|uniref:ThiF family adenylyltransferase n=1 Tax=Terricaulis sp. TaxID=2768686 RepID=UPI002AC48C28|nr:ThiF family adenylyltransferase [Terricaulis sp.]MDZ4690021.1 ThiF family adenylyltransferase [Terricaulis sp.]
MFQKLVSHNGDIERLVEKGYAVAFDDGYLVVRDVPYLDAAKALQWGVIVTKLVFIDNQRVRQDDHQIFFAGGVPHNLNGAAIPNLGGGPTTLALGEGFEDVVVQRSFSNKPVPEGKFSDFFAKIESYVAIISGPAIEVYGVTPLSYKVDKTNRGNPIFRFHDTLTSRAEIGDLSALMKNDVVAVIGLGGTGGYLLDFLVKTPVQEIRGFDLDVFHVHNAYRSPGRFNPAELDKTKAEIYRDRYENFRTGLNIEAKYIDSASAAELEGVTFAFVCVDKGPARAAIFDILMQLAIPFIDVGLGLNRKRGPLNGMLRATYYSRERAQKTRGEGHAELSEQPDALYHKNVQICELNALNASLAIIKFKQLRGFYVEDGGIYHLLFEIADMKVVTQAEDDDVQT